MHLSVRLALSHLAVIVLFLVVFGLTFTLLNAPAQPGNRRQLWRVRQLLESGQEARIPSVGLAPEASLEVYLPGGQVRHLHGPARPTPKHLPEGVWDGADIAQFSSAEGVSFWFPIRRQGQITAVARLAGLRSREELRRTAAGGVLMACLAATVFCLLASWGLSRALAGPARRLAATAEQFGSHNLEVRAVPEGPVEMVELGKSFNRMADRLSQNVEELQRSESARRLFLSDVSHNLRTPLAAIVGWADALSEEPEPDEAAVMLTRLRREALYVSRTIERLLDLSRWDQAEPMLRLEPVVLADILMEVAETLEEAAQRKSIELEFVGLEAGLTVQADRHRLRELVQILLENVIDHAGPQVRAEVAVESVDGRVKVSIRDDGVGFAQDASAREHGRVSLGLAIARRLATAHGGSLEIDSQPGGGTRASFSLARG